MKEILTAIIIVIIAALGPTILSGLRRFLTGAYRASNPHEAALFDELGLIPRGRQREAVCSKLRDQLEMIKDMEIE